MKKTASKKTVVRPAEELASLTARVKVAEAHAETTRHIAQLSKQKLKSARRTYKHVRKVAKRARKAAAKLRQELATAMKKLAHQKARAGKAKPSSKTTKLS